jgi:hypothetical protein
MKQLTFSVFAALYCLVLYFSPAEPGQFQSRGHIVGQQRLGARFSFPAFRGSQVIIVTPGPNRFFRSAPFQRVIIVPNHNFAGRRVIVSHSFFCFPHHLGFFHRDVFFDHLHRFHGLAFESIPRVIVQNGPQVIFFDENSEVLATPTEDILMDQE